MLRRSPRLRLSGYYLPEDDAVESHDGLTWKISYKETPARKLLTRRGRSATPTMTSIYENELQTPYIAEYSDDGVYDMDVNSDFKVAAQNMNKMIKTESCPDLSCCQSGAFAFPPEHHLTDEQDHSSTFNDSTHDLEYSRFAFMDALLSPDLALAVFCGWLEKTWQTLTHNISRMHQSYDFHLNSAGVTKAVMIFLIICLFGGLWYFLPFASPFHWCHIEVLPPYTNTPARDPSHLSDEILSKIRNEITAVREREANMMKDITLLKLGNEKQKLKFKIFLKDVTMQELNLESEYHQQISDLRSDVSNIREASDVLKQRLDTQKPLNTKDVADIIQSALSLHKSDGTGMADYALESAGGSVISTRCSETYQSKSTQFSLFGIPLWYYSEPPRTVIQPEVHPGKCWAFRGSKGFLAIALSYPIRITHVTLEHIPKTLSPTGRTDSAPKDFVVYGSSSQNTVCDGGQLLGSFTYNQDGDPIQTFKINDSTQVYNTVELRILSNWGHPEYTCVYRFRVHGVPWVTNGLK